ncbi:MAG: 5'/3'-nucleotidase SurE [Spartobacteria bacterium]|nr:5'/3'-nucleotidase SurE [Spartobacteria bacterium]
MNILISNDDGIYSPGIETLYQAASKFGQVFVVAPDSERSATGHGITISDPIKAKPVKLPLFSGYATSGTPADCVKLACGGLLDIRPDLVLSGINLGANTGVSVAYSGTVSAAAEAAIQGIPGIAFSLCTFANPLWKTAGSIVEEFITRYLKTKNDWPTNTLINVNIPNTTKIKGFKTVPIARSRFEQLFHKRKDPRGNTYFWMDGKIQSLDSREENDLWAVDNGYVSVSPVAFAATRSELLPSLKNMFTK